MTGPRVHKVFRVSPEMMAWTVLRESREHRDRKASKEALALMAAMDRKVFKEFRERSATPAPRVYRAMKGRRVQPD